MKAMLKSEMARAAGVSVKTLNSWCRPYRKQLTKMGWKPRTKIIPPKAAAFIVEEFCIDVEETEGNGRKRK